MKIKRLTPYAGKSTPFFNPCDLSCNLVLEKTGIFTVHEAIQSSNHEGPHHFCVVHDLPAHDILYGYHRSF